MFANHYIFDVGPHDPISDLDSPRDVVVPLCYQSPHTSSCCCSHRVKDRSPLVHFSVNLQLFRENGKAAELYDTVARAARFEVCLQPEVRDKTMAFESPLTMLGVEYSPGPLFRGGGWFVRRPVDATLHSGLTPADLL